MDVVYWQTLQGIGGKGLLSSHNHVILAQATFCIYWHPQTTAHLLYKL